MTGTTGAPTAGAWRGVGVSPGRAVGPVAWLRAASTEPPPASPAPDPEAATATALDALQWVADDLRARAASARTREAADVLEATALMADDPAVAGSTASRVPASGAARAAWDALTGFAATLESAGGYLGERARDVRDVRDRVVSRITGAPLPGMPHPGDRFVLVAEDLAPADTADLDPETVLALVTCEGGPTGHTAIIARALGLPAVVACPAARHLLDGETAVVDGRAGTVSRAARVGVADGTVRREGAAADAANRPAALPAGGARLADGTAVALAANVGDEAGAAAAAELGVTACGLFRTELLFLDRTTPPDRAEQAAAYAAVLRHLPGPVVVRTLDAGADKPLPFLTTPEPNPALGVRGLRALIARTDLLDDQLGAIADARDTSGSTVWTMAPMVTTPDEARWFKERCTAAGLPVAGVMIEVPAAAVMATEILAEVDFVSVGTNDLTQYTLAADRVLGALAALNDPWQPAVLRLVAGTARAGADAGKYVGVCGEAASDPLLAAVLVGLGVSSLSATPALLPAVAEALARHDPAACRAAATAAVAAASADAARATARAVLEGVSAGARPA
ncbi:MAG: putative PEP-binding protein [Kineosporiaceae bacterium]